MPRRHSRRRKDLDTWDEQEAPARYSTDWDSEDSRSTHRSSDNKCRSDEEDETARFFFRSNGSTIWNQRRWSTVKHNGCCFIDRLAEATEQRGATEAIRTTEAAGETETAGATGATGMAEDTGITVRCECLCQSSDEVILNGEMESSADSIPGLTIDAPVGATSSGISFDVTAESGQSADLDDVSPEMQ